MLLKLSKGQGRFTDFPIYNLPLICDIPVISAMQGHAVGGGARLRTVFRFRRAGARVRLYRELYEVRIHAGIRLDARHTGEIRTAARAGALDDDGELPRRGVERERHRFSGSAAGASDRTRDRNREAAIGQAASFALKAHMTARLREALPGVAERELVMHEQTFRHPEVQDRIKNLFDH